MACMVQYFGNTEISKLYRSLGIDEDILSFDVSMENFMFMQVI